MLPEQMLEKQSLKCNLIGCLHDADIWTLNVMMRKEWWAHVTEDRLHATGAWKESPRKTDQSSVADLSIIVSYK